MKTAILILAFTCAFAAAFAQNKGLDLTFGKGGIAPTAVYTNTKFKIPTGLIIQPDGKILISGNFIARYKSNGTPDSSFAANGFFKPPYSGFANAIALLPDGKILSIGGPDTGCSYIVRLLPNGAADPSFGQNGFSKNSRFNPGGILVQPDGKIIMMGNGCGNVGNPHNPEDSVIIARLLPDGLVDTTFGKKGFAGAYLGNYGGSITNIGLLPDGRIAMGGIGHDDSGFVKMIALRFLPNGQLDNSLGGKGRIFPFDAWYCHGLAVLLDGRMVFTLADLDNEDVTRLNADGSPDTTFGNGGFISIDGQSTLSILPLSDGRILCGGIRQGDYAIACLRPNGKGLDASFGQNGSISTDITGYWEDYLIKIALQADNKIVGVGKGAWDKNTVAGVMLVRYHANAATGIQASNPSAIALLVYPNPARTDIRLSGIRQNQLASVRIIAADGRLMKYIDAPHSLTIPVNGYAPGVYMLSVVLKSGEAASGRFTIAE